MACEPPRGGAGSRAVAGSARSSSIPPPRGPDPVNPLAAQLLPERVAATSRSCPGLANADGYLTVAVADPRDALGFEVARTLTAAAAGLVAPPTRSPRDRPRLRRARRARRPPAEPDEYAPERRAPRRDPAGARPDPEDELTEGPRDSRTAPAPPRRDPRSRRLIREDDLAAALAEQLQVPLRRPGGVEPDPAALALIPEQLQRATAASRSTSTTTRCTCCVADLLDDEVYAELREHTDLARSASTSRPRSAIDSAAAHGAPGRVRARGAHRVARPASPRTAPTASCHWAAAALPDPARDRGPRRLRLLARSTTAIVLHRASVVIYAVASLYKLLLFYDSFGRRRELVIHPGGGRRDRRTRAAPSTRSWFRSTRRRGAPRSSQTSTRSTTRRRSSRSCCCWRRTTTRRSRSSS